MIQRRFQTTSERRPIKKWIKAAVVGILGALIMFIFIAFAVQRDIAPFNSPPSAAMLTTLGINVEPLALLVHFGYGAFWSMALVYIFKERTNVWNGMGLATALWLVMMIIYSPINGAIIGWLNPLWIQFRTGPSR